MVIEAKMFSDLSSGTKNAPTYTQAARNVACMAEAVMRSGRHLSSFERLGFYVIAPEARRRQPSQRLLDPATKSEALEEAVRERIAAYAAAQRTEAADLATWHAAHFAPLLKRISEEAELGVLSWEDCIACVDRHDPSSGRDLAAFYESCLEFGAGEVAQSPGVELTV